MKNTDLYGSPTPLDDIFKTECVRHPKMLIPLLREIFQDLPEDVDIVPEPVNNEHLKSSADISSEGWQKRYTDSCIRINDRFYHLEAQSTNDGSIMFRLVEYDLLIALEHPQYDPIQRKLILELPRSALLYLRRGKPGKAKLNSSEVVIRHEGREFSYQIPVLSVQTYNRQELINKGLYFLVPFFFLRYEKKIRKKHNDKWIMREMNLLASDIRQAMENGLLSEAEGKEIAACTKYLIRYVMRSRDSVDQERMVRTMGGQVLDFLFDEELFKKKLDEMKSELDEKESELKEKRFKLKETKSELKETMSELKETMSELKETMSELKETMSELKEKDSELKEKDSELKEKDSELKEMSSTLKEKDSEIAMLREKLKVAGIPY